MKSVVQRVTQCSVTSGEKTLGSIGNGLLVYLGVSKTDTEKDADYTVRKISGLRIFPDHEGKMNLDISQTGGEILVVSQFTLYGDTRKGKRPSYNDAAPPEKGERLYSYAVNALRDLGFSVATGEFGAIMEVTYTNNGPVTIIIESS
ncbi:MAG: D-aminoacyl-tRNA deacylase [Spirochaetia bacterium]